MPRFRAAFLALASAGALLAGPAFAQQRDIIDLSGLDLSGFDPLAAVMAAEDLVLRAPDRDIDQLFRAVHASMQSDDDASTLCAMFDSGAQNDIDSLQRAANALGPQSRQRFVDALAAVAVGGLQNGRQAYDAEVGKQALKSAGAKATFLHEGFVEGMATAGSDPESRALRCRSLRWLVGSLEGFPDVERVAATRFLMSEGLSAYRQTL